MADFRSLVNRVLKHSTTAFGEEVTFYPKAGRVFKVRAIFDNSYQALDPDTERVVSVNQPALGVNLNDLPEEIQIHDEVVIRKIRFRIVDKQEDGQGGATLLIHKVKPSDRIRDTKAPEAQD